MQNISKLLNDAIAYAKPYVPEGQVASYIPELAKASPSDLGISMILDGTQYTAGDANVSFTMQSVAKVFALILALETAGPEALFQRVGMSPSEEPFNCLPAVIDGKCIPANPMLNAGCFVTLDSIRSEDTWQLFLSRVRTLCSNPGIQMNETVYQSEKNCSQRNREILKILDQNHALHSRPEQILDLHIRSSSLFVTASDLAFFAAVLANGGHDPYTGKPLVDAEIVKLVRTIMFLCGMYNATGRFAAAIGLPAKSGVGGGIVAAGQGIGIATFGPALDAFGNSVGGQRILEYISGKLKLHIFANDRL